MRLFYFILFAILCWFSCSTQPQESNNSPNNDIELEEISITQLQQGYQNGDFTITEVIQTFLDRIEALDKNGPQLNSITPDLISFDIYCQCLSPQTVTMFFCSPMNLRTRSPSCWNPILAWLSFLFPRSGPTMGVGLMSTLNVALERSTVDLSQSICSFPQIDFSGPSSMGFWLR